MIVAAIPKNEKERLKELKEFDILDTLPEEEYDDIVHIASSICQTPIAMISLVDEKRLWFKASIGIGAKELPRDLSVCAHALHDTQNPTIILDSRKDNRFFDNPLVTGSTSLIFYTGFPLIAPSGLPLGTICVMDTKPNQLSEEQLKTLKALSAHVVSLLELRRSKKRLKAVNSNLVEKNKVLEEFVMMAGHDLSSPLRNISSILEMFWDSYSKKLDDDGKQMLSYIGKSTDQLGRLLNDMLDYSVSDGIANQEKETIELNEFLIETCSLLNPRGLHQITFVGTEVNIQINVAGLKQIILNLVSNAIKYNDKNVVIIEIGFSEDDQFFNFYVKDNGAGISEDKYEDIFKEFEVLQTQDRFGNKSTGLGLSAIRKIILAQGGAISVESKIDVGSIFNFTIEK